METLNSEIKHELVTQGACLVGFADVGNLSNKVTGGLQRAVSIAVALNPVIVREISEGPTKEYLAEYERVNTLLAELCERVVKILAKVDKRAKAIETTTAHFDERTLSVSLQHKTIATRAGLGWIGKSALLITKKYGAAVRLGTVLTDAEFEIGEPVNDSLCGVCMNCVEACPANAITGRNWELGLEREAIYDAFACFDTAQKLSKRLSLTPNLVICGICINVCPWTQKYISRTLSGKKIRKMLKIIKATTSKDIESAKNLFTEYADSLGFDLDFQDFDKELANLRGGYASPKGCLLIAEYKEQIAGCVGLKQFSDGICEMKRLYVRPQFRGLGIGRALTEAIIEQAQKAGYNLMRLDMVLPRDAARKLYLSLGFKDIEPYRYNPIEGAVFMELKLV